MDNFKDNEFATVQSTGAEYVVMRPDGKMVIITDETYGFGVITYECEAGVNCAGTATTTTATTGGTGSTPTITTPTISTSAGTTSSTTPAANCLQARINQFCSANSQYSFARFGEDEQWGCYEKLNTAGAMAFQCVNEQGNDLISCIKYADDSLFTQLDTAIIGEAGKGCDATTTATTTTTVTTPVTSSATTTTKPVTTTTTTTPSGTTPTVSSPGMLLLSFFM